MTDPLLRELRRPGLLRYDQLSTPQALKAYEKLLPRLFKNAKGEFLDLMEAHASNQPTFASLLEPLFALDRDLTTLWTFLGNLSRAQTSKQTRRLIERFQPQAVELHHLMMHDTRLFELTRSVQGYQKKLTDEQKRSLELLIRAMQFAGVHLPPAKKRRLAAIDRRLHELSERFQQHEHESRNEFSHVFCDDAAFGEMPEQQRLQAQEEAKRRNLQGWVFTLSTPSYLAIMRYCTDRGIRRKFFDANVHVATGDRHNNRPLVLEMLKLREEKARLLGYGSFAAYMMHDRMVENPERVTKMLKRFTDHCRGAARKEVRSLQRMSESDTLEWWDLSFYAERLRSQTFNISEKGLQEYFSFPHVLQGLFQVAKKLFGINMREIRTASYAPGVLSFEVLRRGKGIGYFLLDAYARPEKRTGAWSCCIRDTDAEGTKLPIVVNVMNAPPPSGAWPSLLKHIDVQTLFHEFGHALHHLLDEGRYVNTRSDSVEWDFIELPSQLLENWCWEPEALSLFAKHYRSSTPLPHHLLQSLRRSREFLSGIYGMNHMHLSLLDVLLHTSKAPRSLAELDRLCAIHGEKFAVFPSHDTYLRYASFHHLFEGSYAGGYYSYLWSEMLEADVFSRFSKRGIFNTLLGEKLRQDIFSVGAKKPAAQMFRAFMGREPSIDALLRKQGLDKGLKGSK